MTRARTTKSDSVVLHEFYFGGIVPEHPASRKEVRQAISKRFGALEKWADDFARRSHAAACCSPVSGKLFNHVSDRCDIGMLWTAMPPLVIDACEHAFYIDYHNGKAVSAKKVLDHFNWHAVGNRCRAAQPGN